MIEKRRFQRLDIPVQLRVKLLGVPQYTQYFKAQTKNVFLEGLLIEMQVFFQNDDLLIQKGENPIKLDPFLVLNEKWAELYLLVPPMNETVRATGKVAWYEIGSRGTLYYCRMGISLEKMGVEDGKKWLNFVRNTLATE